MFWPFRLLISLRAFIFRMLCTKGSIKIARVHTTRLIDIAQLHETEN